MTQSQLIPITREGFRLKKDRFTLPNDASPLDPKCKRAVTALADIVRLLDEDTGGLSWHYWSNGSSETAETTHKNHRMGRNEGKLRVSAVGVTDCWKAV